MKYFGTDGIRGKASELLNYDLAYKVGRSLGILEKKRVVISRDTRESGLMLVKALKNGIIDAGLEVLDIDIQSTPILAYMTILNDCHGIMVTASHNPYQDNGIKVFNKGKKTLPQEEQVIEDVIDGKVTLDNLEGGIILPYENPLLNYMKLYKDILTKYNGKITLDLANGATINSAKHVFNTITQELDFIGDVPNGKNINEGVGSTHLDNLANHVKTNGIDIGFAFDGDGDRVLTIAADGTVIDGDLMIYIFASYLKEIGQLDNDLVVLTKMSNLGIIEALANKGIKTIQADIGDKWVIQAMEDNGAVIGGENSGHIINKKLFISGDGVLNAAFLIKILNEKKITVLDLVKEVKFYPDRLFNLKNVDREIVKDPRIKSMVQDFEAELGKSGKVLVRPSGTEPLIRISVSAKSKEQVDSIIQTIADKILEISKEKE